ncbi:uncharacterized protein TM35_000161000 [Trypanosoma theileri]|uniref:Uncharacterized protein n=1 Tax=Trypanosoma theileri TaxID=67003 RepID=A0A1X0NUV5_9TRYP|nr:uncharacterized protein TM35_000161000 [Trypanosoma theileri]ORC88462.1 hypothetical protein TM35_000161000 [Trypanosoma theileri]
MTIRECHGDMQRGNNNSSAYNFDYYEDTVQTMQQPQPTYQAMPMYGMPVEQPFDTRYQSHAENNVETSLMRKPSKRQRQRGRTSSNVFSEVEVPKGQEIEEGGDDAALQEATKLRRGGRVVQFAQEQDVETIEF